MKKCQYCSELVQDDAKKCKHCGEWFSERKTSIFSKAKKFIKKRKEEKEKKENSHLYLPTSDKPMVIGNAEFFDTYCIIKNVKIDYKNIFHIEYKTSSSELNFVKSCDINFCIHHKGSGEEENLIRTIIVGTFDRLEHGKGVITGKVNKKNFERVSLIKKFISEKTLKQRTGNYINSLKNNALFVYIMLYYDETKLFKFHNNGDVELHNTVLANLKNRWDSEKLEWKMSKSGLYSFSYDPYTLSFVNDTLESKKLSKKRTDIEIIFDSDIIEPLLLKLFQTGKFL